MKSLSRSFSKACPAKHNLDPGPKLATLLLLLPLTVNAEWFGDARPMMGTEVSVYLWSKDPEAGPAAVEAVFQEADRIDRLMSTYKDDSEISKINREAADEPVRTGEELYQLIERSLEISVLTQGAFDITYESVGQHFDFRSRHRPDEATVKSELENINFRFVQLDARNAHSRVSEAGRSNQSRRHRQGLRR